MDSVIAGGGRGGCSTHSSAGKRLQTPKAGRGGGPLTREPQTTKGQPVDLVPRDV